MTVTSIQRDSIDGILCARTQGRKAMAFNLSLLNKNPRVISGIHKKHDRSLLKLGLQSDLIAASWKDVVDMARLEHDSSE